MRIQSHIVLKLVQFICKIRKIMVANARLRVYTKQCCGMIAMKREVAATSKDIAGFPWSECQVMKLTTSHCTEYSLQQSRNDVYVKTFYEVITRHTRESVQSPLVVLSSI